MNLEAHTGRDDMKVWLSTRETDELLEATKDSQQEIALSLAVRCGLRSHEVLQVAPRHIHDTDAGLMLRVWHGKGDKYRETPISQTLTKQIQIVDEYRDADDATPIIDATSTRTLRRWASKAADSVDSDDSGWQYVSMHDLRRTWATQLRNAEVDPMVVCDWGGWNDLETFLDHYRGTSSPDAQRRERGKVDWL